MLLTSLDALQTEVVQAPRVLVNPFQEAALTAIDELAYIKDYELKVIPDQQLELVEPIPSVQTTLGAGRHEVTVQVPEITTIKIEGRFRIFSGQTLMMASVDPEGDREVLVLVRVVRVPAIRPGIGQDR